MSYNVRSTSAKLTAKNISAPIKATTILLTAIMLSACGSDNDSSYNLNEIFDGPSDTNNGNTGATGGNTGATGGNTGATGGNTGATGGNTGATGGNTGATGGNTGATGGNTGATGGNTGATGGNTGGNPAYTSSAASTLSGAQHISIDSNGANGLGPLNTTTRDFVIRSKADIDARADKAIALVPGPVAVTIGSTGTVSSFTSYNGKATVLSPDDLTYTAVYRDFGSQMRIGHIDGEVNSTSLNAIIPVNGVAVVGNKTSALPTEGNFAYEGVATNRKVGPGNNIEYGQSAFSADFVKKTVDGNLSFSQAGSVSLAGTISGSDFTGTKGGYNTEGSFYGNDAKLIGGIYEGNGAQGTFGAEKK